MRISNAEGHWEEVSWEAWDRLPEAERGVVYLGGGVSVPVRRIR